MALIPGLWEEGGKRVKAEEGFAAWTTRWKTGTLTKTGDAKESEVLNSGFTWGQPKIDLRSSGD